MVTHQEPRRHDEDSTAGIPCPSYHHKWWPRFLVIRILLLVSINEWLNANAWEWEQSESVLVKIRPRCPSIQSWTELCYTGRSLVSDLPVCVSLNTRRYVQGWLCAAGTRSRKANACTRGTREKQGSAAVLRDVALVKHCEVLPACFSPLAKHMPSPWKAKIGI